MPKTRLLFVCLGNICRSPLAKAVFLHKVRVRGDGLAGRFEVDSCGLGNWHVGGPADPRTVACARRRSVELVHTARQVEPGRDFSGFDLLLAMDRDNVRGLLDLGAPRERVRLMRGFDPQFAGQGEDQVPDVPDPYTGGPEGFDRVFDMLWVSCDGLLDHCLRGNEHS